MPAVRTIPREQLDELLDQSDLRPKGEKEAQQKVLEFLEECALEKEDGDVDVHLMQQSRGSGVAQNICSFKVRAGDDLSEVAGQIVDDAIRDARDGACSGKVRYAVNASGRRGRRSFVLTFPSTGDDDFDETPNERGALAQVMRQNEQILRFAQETFQDVTRQQSRMIEQQAKMLQKHEELAGKNWAIFGDLMTASHERQIALVKADRGERRLDEVAGFLMTAGQVVFNTFLGKRIFAQAPTPIEHQTYAFLSTVSPEQVQGVVREQQLVLRGEQALGFLQLMKTLDEDYRARRQAAGETPPPQAYEPPAHANGHANGQANGHTHHPPHADPASAAT